VQRPLGTLAARSVTIHHGPQLVLDSVSVTVAPGSRTGVVGPNGIGKSTLLRVLAGLEQPDSGTLARAPATTTVGYLPQEPDSRPAETLLGYLARRTGVAAAGHELDELAGRLEREPALAVAYSDALERLLALGGDDFEARAREVSAAVGLGAARLDRPHGQLSGGEAARASLAAILLSRFDVLLLDEPTNNLDFDGLGRLERFVDGFAGGLVVVSHDRAFLDRTVTRILELEEGTRHAREFPGGWSEYEQARAHVRARHYAAFDGYVAERERIREQARRMREWEERGYGQARGKKKSKDVKKAFEKKLERLERVDKPYEPWELRLELAATEQRAEVVARLDRGVVRRGLFSLGPTSLELRRGDRLAIVGPNGSGKTTLLGALTGDLPLAGGTRWARPGLAFGVLPQGPGEFADRSRLLDAFVARSRQGPEAARTLLAKFRLGAEHVLRRGETLSPGERSRAALALLAARGTDVLVLDEPTNHLDLPAIEELEAALERFGGTVVLVTHDRRLLERFAPTATIELGTSERARAPV